MRSFYRLGKFSSSGIRLAESQLFHSGLVRMYLRRRVKIFYTLTLTQISHIRHTVTFKSPQMVFIDYFVFFPTIYHLLTVPGRSLVWTSDGIFMCRVVTVTHSTWCEVVRNNAVLCFYVLGSLVNITLIHSLLKDFLSQNIGMTKPQRVMNSLSETEGEGICSYVEKRQVLSFSRGEDRQMDKNSACKNSCKHLCALNHTAGLCHSEGGQFLIPDYLISSNKSRIHFFLKCSS